MTVIPVNSSIPQQPTPSPSTEGGPVQGLLIAIGSGVGVTTIVTVALIAFFNFRRRQNKISNFPVAVQLDTLPVAVCVDVLPHHAAHLPLALSVDTPSSVAVSAFNQS